MHDYYWGYFKNWILLFMKKKICFVTATPSVAESFLKDHIIALNDNYDVYLATNLFAVGDASLLKIKDAYHIDLLRKISIKNDLIAVWQLYRFFKQMKFAAVHSVTPKAGLITALAAWLSGVKHRVHIFTGQVWATRHGLMRFLLKSIDRIIALLDNHILVDGESQRKFLINNRIVKADKSRVFGSGSICGVNTEKFNPSIEDRTRIRKQYNIEDGKIVFSFMGRMNKEKGIFELFEAFDNLVHDYPEAILVCWGRDEGNCMNYLSNYNNIVEGKNFFYYGLSTNPGFHLQASDIFVMPSYREGFGSSVIEASCLGIPVICSDAYGIMDAMVEGETGLRCKVADVRSLQNAMEILLLNNDLRKRLGENGRKRVLEKFRGSMITAEWVKFYNCILS